MSNCVICPSCNGKGHVIDAVNVLALNVFSLLLAPLERNDADGLTRKDCCQCHGKGLIKNEA
jgi:DnaJ-class molecular chaperone